MRRILMLIGALICVCLYCVWPLYTAWAIKEAVKSGDSAVLAQHIEWTPVKATLKESMFDLAVKPGDPSLPEAPRRKGLWERFRQFYTRGMVNSLVERYANPNGLPTLFSYGRTVRRDVLGRPDPDDGLPLQQRIANAWARVLRAEFITPTRFEIDMRDKYEPERVYAGVLELKWWRWVVTELRVRQRPRNADQAAAKLQLSQMTLLR
jgi:Protein of unknown function (DUF2939)